MKKFLCVFTIFIMMVSSFAGCGSKGGSKDSNKNEQTSNNPVKSSTNDASKNSETGVKVDMGKIGTGLSLPDGFPKDVVPLLGDANIINVIDNKAAKAIGITYTTGKKFEDAVAFYSQVLKDAGERSETKTDGGYLLFGKKAGIDLSVVVSKYEGEKVSILLNVSTANKETSGSTTPAENNKFENAKTVQLPENYPKAKLPIINGDKIVEASLTESDSGKSYNLMLMSTKKIKDIVDYYDSKWGAIVNKYKNVSSQDFELQGEIEKYSISIRGEIQDDKTQVIEYYISIDENKE
jgi:predicted small lipoprotein YifL